MKRRTVPKSNPWARPCLKIAILGLLLAPASTVIAAEHGNAPRALTTPLPSATEAYLRRSFGFGLVDAGALITFF